MESHTPKQEQTHSPVTQYPMETYEILIQEELDSLWEQWFEGMTLSIIDNQESGVPCTLISGQVADQPALHSLLTKIRDLNLTLLLVRRISPRTKISEDIKDVRFDGS